MANVFYVYEHWRPDTDFPFYVGKGKGARAYKFRGRNKHHQNIVNKLADLGMCVEVRLVASSLSEDAAFKIEKERIAMWRDFGISLCNKTDGGDGVSGFVMPDEARRKMSVAKKGKPGRATMAGRKHSAETKKKMSEAQKGKPKSHEHSAKVGASNRGKVISEEAKKKMSDAKKGKKQSPEHIAAAAAGVKAWWAARKKVQA